MGLTDLGEGVNRASGLRVWTSRQRLGGSTTRYEYTSESGFEQSVKRLSSGFVRGSLKKFVDENLIRFILLGCEFLELH